MILRRSTPCFTLLNFAARSATSALLTTWRMDIVVLISSPRADAAVRRYGGELAKKSTHRLTLRKEVLAQRQTRDSHLRVPPEWESVCLFFISDRTRPAPPGCDATKHRPIEVVDRATEIT
ncbi:hypothetical protein EVAR_59542_1 [Eumeta japonica]|uniref:Uncharacterized protein n=1 Tax=Eumeta variegata TaxID=151549 RepID=A0A4C1T7C9_EUMVA|nr:hypothetical protein EVAR_59542_1 [Eumeta japonica]